MHKIKETVCNDASPHERGKKERTDYRDCRKRDGDGQFPDQRVT